MRCCGMQRVGYCHVRAWVCVVSGSGLGWPAGVGESPVREDHALCVVVFPSSSGPVKSAVNLPGPPGKPEYPV